MIHLGDCIEWMATIADRSVDHVITDPPFSERVHARLGLEDRADGSDSRQSLTFAGLSDQFVLLVTQHLCRITKRWIILFCDEVSLVAWKGAIESCGGDYIRGGTWVKTDPMPQITGDRPAQGTESIVVAHAPRKKGDGRTRWNGGGRPATWTCPIERDGRMHPTQKPKRLMESLVRDFTDHDELVCDPFAGSGTTGVAALRNGRRFIGCELDPKYHAIAMSRIGRTHEQRELAL